MSLLNNVVKPFQFKPSTVTWLKTMLGLGLLAGGVGAVGYAIGGLYGLYWGIGFQAALSTTFMWFSREIAFFISGIKEVKDGQLVEGFDLHKMVRELKDHPNIQLSAMPKIGIKESDILNAFATGRHKGHAGIAIFSGLLKQAKKTAPSTPFTAEELVKAVLLHELGHIANRDIATSTAVALIVFTLKKSSNTWYRNHFYPNDTAQVKTTRVRFKENDSKSKESTETNNMPDETNANRAWLKPLVFVVGWTVPLFTMIIKAFISRSRETAADEIAHQCGQGEALQHALAMLKEGVYKDEAVSDLEMKRIYEEFKDLDHSLFCHNHLSELSSNAKEQDKPKGWFARGVGFCQKLNRTHPPVEERIQHLKDLDAYEEKENQAGINPT